MSEQRAIRVTRDAAFIGTDEEPAVLVEIHNPNRDKWEPLFLRRGEAEALHRLLGEELTRFGNP
jgi:hypothetical protein